VVDRRKPNANTWLKPGVNETARTPGDSEALDIELMLVQDYLVVPDNCRQAL
jgi:hypothetical protein